MHTPKKRLATAATAAVLLSLPGAAAAATPGLFSTPITVKGFSLTLAGQRTVVLHSTGTSSSVSLFRTRGAGIESYSISATKKVTYKAKANLSSATLRASFGSYGKVSMKFRATGKTTRKVPKGCKGKAGASRKGTLTGTFKIRLDKRHFRTIKRSSLPGVLATFGTFTCGGGGTVKVPKTAFSLNVFPPAQKAGTSFTITKDTKGHVSEQASDFKVNQAAGITYSRFMATTGGRGALVAAKDLSSATVKGIGPLFGGTAKFKASGRPSKTFATGTLKGSLVAKFVSGGRAKLPAGGIANLTK